MSESSVVRAAGVAIFNDSAQLLLGRHQHDRRWATFGGRVEAGESAPNAAIREVREELGLELAGQIQELGVFGDSPIYTVNYPDWGPTTYEVTMFATILRGHVELVLDTEEIAEARWIDASDVARIELARDMQEIVPAACAWHSIHRRHAS
ncbi:NUDIX domain-containing protein [Microlunatus soli]|uniref:NUDIX domain-containing protein n=1 Tax=Microlunatus soli TaxID=630515 RepID=A0A1H2A9B4_9ACTN|nr:NUDIX hydrolase [Microlunatus soli]SDT42581.1 NUDIX domain-containing protein [Microlunatus soli]